MQLRFPLEELADTDLHRLIQSSCPLTEGHIRVIMFQVLSGVKCMHDNGVLHRDLKPGNLLLNKDCELKVTMLTKSHAAISWVADFLVFETYQITDFGLARMVPKENQHADEEGGASTTVSPMTECKAHTQ